VGHAETRAMSGAEVLNEVDLTAESQEEIDLTHSESNGQTYFESCEEIGFAQTPVLRFRSDPSSSSSSSCMASSSSNSSSSSSYYSGLATVVCVDDNCISSLPSVSSSSVGDIDGHSRHSASSVVVFDVDVLPSPSSSKQKAGVVEYRSPLSLPSSNEPRARKRATVCIDVDTFSSVSSSSSFPSSPPSSSSSSSPSPRCVTTETEGRQLQQDEAEARRLQAHEERKAARRAECKSAEDSGRDVLKEHRARVAPFIVKQGAQFRTVALEANPLAEPGQPLYERFLEAWTDTDMNVKLCFHGTYEKNVAAILREGLDPKRRTGQALGVGEYFGGNAVVSLPYCRGGSKMVVFAVLTDPSGVTAQVANKDVVVVHKVEHQLPLFTWTFKHGGPLYGPPPVTLPLTAAAIQRMIMPPRAVLGKRGRRAL